MTGDKQHDATAEFNEALAAGFAARNFEALGPFYTEDATILPPRGRLLEGRGAASAFWAGVANRFSSAVFTTASVKDLGDAARRETGTYVMSGEGQAAEGKYVFVWQLVDGEWHIESAIWNRSAGDGGQGRQGQGQGRGMGQGQGRGMGQGRQGARGAGGQGGYRRAGGAGAGGYRGGVAGAGGYRAGGGRPSFQTPGGGGGRAGAGRRGGGGQGRGQGGAPGGALYEGDGGLYSEPKG